MSASESAKNIREGGEKKKEHKQWGYHVTWLLYKRIFTIFYIEEERKVIFKEDIV